MKRTYEEIHKKKTESPVPKSIRNKSLGNLLFINTFMLRVEGGFTSDDLINNPTKCIEFISKILAISKRTAYDYYTTLLYINSNYHENYVNLVSSIE